MPIGCTAFLFNGQANGLITAGHCCAGVIAVADTVQFNIPPSDPDGTPNNPPPEDQYPIDQASIQCQWVNLGLCEFGQDWCYFGVFQNRTDPNDPYTPLQRQQVSYQIVNTVPPSDFSTLRVTGYGIDCDPQTGERNEDSQTEQTATGPYLSNTADRINYIIYIQPANSGSAVERECHRLVYAVHTNSGCFGSFHVLGGGTRIDHQPLQDALANPQGVCKDCNENGIDDACDIDCGVPGCISPCGGSTDCNSDGTPDECQPNIDCNSNGTQDICDIGSGTSQDCNGNTVPDECDIASARSMDCICNGIPDECDIASGNSADTDDDCLLDECNGPCCMPDGTCVDDTAQVCCEALGGVWSFFGAEDCASLPFRCPAIFGPQPGP